MFLLTRTLTVCIIDLQLKLFDTIVLSINTYDCEIWGYRMIIDIENIHVTFLKYLLNISKTACSTMIYEEWDKYQISFHANVIVIGWVTRNLPCVVWM